MCDVCLGMSGCPVCTPEPEHEPCERCDGEGILYFYENPETGEIVEVDKSEYKRLPAGDKFDEECEECDGEGEIYGEMPMTAKERRIRHWEDYADYHEPNFSL